MSTFERWSVVITGLGLVVNSVVLIFLVFQVRLASRATRAATLQAVASETATTHAAKQLELSEKAIQDATEQRAREDTRNNKLATMQFLSSSMASLSATYDRMPAAGSSKTAEFVERASHRETPEFRDLRNYLNYLEDVCAGIHAGIFDAEVVHRSVGGRINRARSTFGGWITTERLRVSPTLYTEMDHALKMFSQLWPEEKT